MLEFFEELIAASLKQPVRVVRSAWLGHIPFAFYVVSKLRPACIVELGTHNAASFATFCQAFDDAGLTGSCIAVDTWEGDVHAGRYDSRVYNEVKAFIDAAGWSFASLLRCTFDSALEKIPDGAVDLLHIDGLRTLEAVTHDYETWKPKLSERGVVLFHDIAVKSRGFGVHLLWEKLKAQYPSYSFDHSSGLGVLGAGADQRALAPLFEAAGDPARNAAVQALFRYAGDAVGVRQAVNERDTLIRRLRAHAENLVQKKTEIATAVIAKPVAVHAEPLVLSKDRTEIIVSFYDARSPENLHTLLSEISRTESSRQVACRVVVNSTRGDAFDTSRIPPHVRIEHRKNTGMNIGAWDHGWRQSNAENFIFLQDECRIVRHDWLDFYLERLSDPMVGLVGEAIALDAPWTTIFRQRSVARSKWFKRVHGEILKHGIDPGLHGRHLQSLVWATRRDVLERIDGFPIGGERKKQCIAAEIGVSRKIIALGLRVEQAGSGKFDSVSHPQWDRRGTEPSPSEDERRLSTAEPVQA